MENKIKNKKLGIVLLVISLIILIIMLQLIGGLNTQSRELGCFNNEDCIKIESSLNIVHISFGAIGFIFALGFYLIFFSKSEEEILKMLKEQKKIRSEEEKFNIMLKALDPFEKKAIQIINKQQGITQNTLRIKADMSKAKLSYVLKDLEKKGLIKKVLKGKTFAIYLR